MIVVLLSSILAAAPIAAVQAAQSTGSLSLTPGAFGGPEYVEVPFSPQLNFSGGALTIEAWIRRADVSTCMTLVGNDFQQSYWLGICNGRLRFYSHGAGSQVDGSGIVPAGKWAHIAATYDGTERRYYINGVLDTASTTFWIPPARPVPAR